jgi:hypothetical protein
MTDRERYEQAALWRQTVLPKLRRVMQELTDAHDTCPVSIERIQISGAIEAADKACVTCVANLMLAHDYLEQADAQG